MNDRLQKAIDDLNYLIAVNSARIKEYETATEKIKNRELQVLFQGMGAESSTHISELSGLIQELGGEVEQGTTLSGDLHRIWLDVKSAFTNHDSKAILEAVECAERGTLDAYSRILEVGDDLTEEALSLVNQQHQAIKNAHTAIERLSQQPIES
ncbi:MAG: PA2169 family four-helix-bundle protein [Cytophagaceae bacterium]|nr:PA2169 family four-helix-bundle protein [Cytophagaceae bacterium]